MKILPLKSRIRQGCSLLLLLFNMVPEVPEQLDKKKIKYMQTEKGVWIVLFPWFSNLRVVDITWGPY